MINDCNDCKYLNITEIEQRLSKNHIPHICTKYNLRVFHYSNNINAYQLYPCQECLKKENYKKQYWIYDGTDLGIACPCCNKSFQSYIHFTEYGSLIEVPNYCPNCGIKIEGKEVE